MLDVSDQVVLWDSKDPGPRVPIVGFSSNLEKVLRLEGVLKLGQWVWTLYTLIGLGFSSNLQSEDRDNHLAQICLSGLRVSQKFDHHHQPDHTPLPIDGSNYKFKRYQRIWKFPPLLSTLSEWWDNSKFSTCAVKEQRPGHSFLNIWLCEHSQVTLPTPNLPVKTCMDPSQILTCEYSQNHWQLL